MDFLIERGWQATHLPRIVERCMCGDEAKRNEFCITFDDGYQSVYEVAYPVLKERKMAATVYVATGSIGSHIGWNGELARRTEPIMTTEQIRELSDDGFEIGSHTVSHRRLTDLSAEDVKRELADSRSALEDITGREVVSLSYPYGAHDSRVLHASIEAGYRYAVCMRLATVTHATNLFEIPRISVRWNTIGAVLLRHIGHAHLEHEE